MQRLLDGLGLRHNEPLPPRLHQYVPELRLLEPFSSVVYSHNFLCREIIQCQGASTDWVCVWGRGQEWMWALRNRSLLSFALSVALSVIANLFIAWLPFPIRNNDGLPTVNQAPCSTIWGDIASPTCCKLWRTWNCDFADAPGGAVRGRKLANLMTRDGDLRDETYKDYWQTCPVPVSNDTRAWEMCGWPLRWLYCRWEQPRGQVFSSEEKLFRIGTRTRRFGPHEWNELPVGICLKSGLINQIFYTGICGVMWFLVCIACPWSVCRRRRLCGKCTVCGYPSSGGRCPECGNQ